MQSDEEEEQEFVALLTAHQGPILAYIRSLMPGFSGASDILQQVNMVLWRKRESFELGTNFKAWSFTVARNMVFTQRRKLKKGAWLIFDDDLAERFAEEFEEDDESLDRAHRALAQCVTQLRPHDLELVRKRYAEEVGLDEYARDLNRSPGTLKARLFKIRANLRRCIELQLQTSPQS
ncbi:sigma-70 family RNA polymerase sigma factor [Roseibacillus persicicus]|uniref:DNA-directed RNA polymerase sigma-70 factor n=1 Tax=Roseibacillus persicicus TaxID=454148 RepID=A0A918WNW6_9BACT|nr:sigma-70 family RNA polymerase sigma factor [Roseibacillus persicicus]MDQ8191747.1 sigma-70 family RNA polymerase sigma factor [Roseibacillus persicicus]GHC63718.1 DNA-directed RNA polymerase sigma-70 factor [Roseibacillus persicicus]